MRRRSFLPIPFALPLYLPLYLPLAQIARAEPTEGEADDVPQALPHHKVSVAQLQAAVAQRFPLRYPVPGLLTLDVQAPTLRLLPALNRMGALMAVEAAGPALERRHRGALDVEFALRYEATDRTVRAHQLRLARLDFPSLQPGVVALLNTYGPVMAERSLLEVVLHTLRPQDLALPDAMGLQPGSMTVTNAGLTIGFVPKARL